MTILPVPRLKWIPASPLAIGTIRTYGTGMFLYGATVVVQGDERWAGAQFASATAIAAPWKWGVVIAALGVCTVLGSLRGRFVLRNIGLYGSAAWLGVFALAVLDAASTDPHVSFAGGFFPATLGVGMLWVARAREGRPADAGLSSRP